MYQTDGSRKRPDAEQYRVRQRLVPVVLREVERSSDPRIPWRTVHALEAAFGDEEQVLRHLVGMWSRALAGRVDGLLEERTSPVATVEQAAAELAAARPALHAVLAQYAEHEVVHRASALDASRAGAPGAQAHAQHVRSRPAPTADEAPRTDEAPRADEALSPVDGTAAAGALRRTIACRWSSMLRVPGREPVV